MSPVPLVSPVFYCKTSVGSSRDTRDRVSVDGGTKIFVGDRVKHIICIGQYVITVL